MRSQQKNQVEDLTAFGKDDKCIEHFDVEISSSGAKEIISLPIVTESLVVLSINGQELVTILCTPANIEELIAGFLWNEGVVKSPDEIQSIDVSADGQVSVSIPTARIDVDFKNYKPSFTSGCGRGTVLHDSTDHKRLKPREFDVTITEEIIYQRMMQLLQEARLYNAAGSIHCTGLADMKKLLFAFEDIGRHNAADKVIGKIFLDRLDASNMLMLTTGRMSSEIVGKAARAGIPILVSLSGPTNLAVEAACYYNMTMIGYVRKTVFRVYAHAERIL